MKKQVYRIKIVTFKNGSQSFYPYKKCGLIWRGIAHDGSLIFGYVSECDTREQAIEAVDKCHSSNKKNQSIHFEYITK